MEDFFAILNAEIDAALVKTKGISDAEKLRKKSHNTSLSPAVRAEAASAYSAIQAVAEAELWESTATVAMFTEQVCDGCGSSHHIFLQYMERQQLKRQPSTQRWQRITKPIAHAILPRQTLIQPHRTHICSDCCVDHGFYLDASQSLLEVKQPLLPSTNYVQEDINAPST